MKNTEPSWPTETSKASIETNGVIWQDAWQKSKCAEASRQQRALSKVVKATKGRK